MTTTARTPSPFALACLLAWLVAFLSGTAHGAPPSGAPVVQVVELYEPDIDPRAQALTNALRDAIFDAGELELNTRSSLLMQLAVEAKCDTKAFGPELVEASDRGLSKACLERIGKRIGAKAFFWGFLFQGEGGRTMVKAHLWQWGEDRAVALPYEPNRRRLAERLYRHLTQPGKVGDVRLVAEGGARRGELIVNGRSGGPFEGTDVELTVPVGELVAEVRAGEKVLARGRGTVAASGVAAVRLETVAEPPTAPATPPAVAPPVTPAPPAQAPSGGWMAPAGWVTLGAGALALGFGVFANARVASLNDDFGSDASLAAYRRGVARGEAACDAADDGLASAEQGAASPSAVRDHCTNRGTWKVVRAASYVGGGLLVAGGAALLLLAPSERSPAGSEVGARRWSAMPSLGPSFAGASFAATW